MSVPEPARDGRSLPILGVPDGETLPPAIAAALEKVGVRWDAGAGDHAERGAPPVVELRVPPGGERRLDAILRASGFVRVGDGTAQRSYVGFETGAGAEGGRWILLLVALPDRVVPIRPAEVAARQGHVVSGSSALMPRPRVPRGRGLTVALLGPDGTGKSTIARSVAAAFPFASRVVYMGLWQRTARRTRPLVPGSDLARRLAFAWRRYLVGRYHRARGRLVIYDRYAYDALAGVPDARSVVERAYLWLLGRSCPSPDLVLVLDVPGVVAFARKGEHGALQLERDRGRLLDLAGRRRRWEVVDANRDQAVVEADVTARIWRRYRARWRA